MTVGINDTIRQARAEALIAAIDAGSGPGKLRFYSGSRPAKGGTPTTLLAELVFASPCGTASSGVITYSALTGEDSAPAGGTATWARFVDSDNTFVQDADIGTDIILSPTAVIQMGGEVTSAGGTQTVGN